MRFRRTLTHLKLQDARIEWDAGIAAYFYCALFEGIICKFGFLFLAGLGAARSADAYSVIPQALSNYLVMDFLNRQMKVAH
jgi:hypothetical protein